MKEAVEGWARGERAVMGMVERVAWVMGVKEMLGLVKEGEDWDWVVRVKLQCIMCKSCFEHGGGKRGTLGCK